MRVKHMLGALYDLDPEAAMPAYITCKNGESCSIYFRKPPQPKPVRARVVKPLSGVQKYNKINNIAQIMRKKGSQRVQVVVENKCYSIYDAVYVKEVLEGKEYVLQGSKRDKHFQPNTTWSVVAEQKIVI